VRCAVGGMGNWGVGGQGKVKDHYQILKHAARSTDRGEQFECCEKAPRAPVPTRGNGSDERRLVYGTRDWPGALKVECISWKRLQGTRIGGVRDGTPLWGTKKGGHQKTRRVRCLSATEPGSGVGIEFSRSNGALMLTHKT